MGFWRMNRWGRKKPVEMMSTFSYLDSLLQIRPRAAIFLENQYNLYDNPNEASFSFYLVHMVVFQLL